MSEPGAIKLDPLWREALGSEFEQPYMRELRAFLVAERQAGKRIFPSGGLWFNAMNSTPLDQVRVVILGQDPYPTPGHAHGLCFSVLPDVRPLPKSLINIFRELRDDLGIENRNGHLARWAAQGVLLLNAVLTVEAGRPGSHQGKGWERFTDRAVAVLNDLPRALAFVLWGSYAQHKGSIIDRRRHLVIESPHPSPLSAHRGFFGSRPFSRINDFLTRQGSPTIDWRTDGLPA